MSAPRATGEEGEEEEEDEGAARGDIDSVPRG